MTSDINSDVQAAVDYCQGFSSDVEVGVDYCQGVNNQVEVGVDYCQGVNRDVRAGVDYCQSVDPGSPATLVEPVADNPPVSSIFVIITILLGSAWCYVRDKREKKEKEGKEEK